MEKSSKFNILKICYEYPPLGGGGGQVVKGLSSQLMHQGHNVDLITMMYKGLRQTEITNNLSIYRIRCIRSSQVVCHPHEMLSYQLSALPKALLLTRRKRYDIIHAHFIFPDGILAYLVSKLTGIPYLITAHGSDVPGFNPDRFVKMHTLLAPVWKAIVRSSSTVVCLSRYLEALLGKALPSAHSIIIPNGFTIGRFRSGKPKLTRILIVSRMFKRKGIQHFLHAIDGLELDHEIHIVGDGPYLNELKQQAKSLPSHINFHGFIENNSEHFSELMETSKILVLPSASENFPVTLLEAMDAGMAIITTKHTGCEEVVGDAGFVVNPGDHKAIRHELVKLTENPDLCSALGKKARRRLDENFSWQAVTGQYVQVYREIIERKMKGSARGSAPEELVQRMTCILRQLETVAKIVIPFPVKLVLRKSIWKFLYLKLKIRNFIRGEKSFNKVFCPISEAFFDEFVPLFKENDTNIPLRKQARISPDSGARDGLRLQWLYLKDETELSKRDIRLLHFGPEYCLHSKFKEMRNIDYFPVDKNNSKYGRDVGYADLSGLNFPADTFDMILCNHILEHVDDDRQAMREMYRVLKPGGTAIITVPIDNSKDETHEDPSITSPRDREREFGQWDHLRYYGSDFDQRLESEGFEVKTEYYARTFSNDDFLKFGLVNEPIFVCKK